MKNIKAKKITRQCMVPGCGCRDSLMVYRTNEPWATVVICERCAKELYQVITPEETKKVAEVTENAPEEVQITEKKPVTRKSSSK